MLSVYLGSNVITLINLYFIIFFKHIKKFILVIFLNYGYTAYSKDKKIWIMLSFYYGFITLLPRAQNDHNKGQKFLKIFGVKK